MADTVYTANDIEQFKQMCLDHSNWKLIYNKGDHEIYSQKSDSKTAKFKCVTKQSKQYDPEYVFSSFCDRGYCKTLKGNDIVFDVVRQIDSCNEIIHRVQKMPMMSPRDFVYKLIRYHNKENTEFILLTQSIEDESVPVMKDATRGHINVQGSYVRKTEEGTILYSYSDINLKGSVPSALFGETMVKTIAKSMLSTSKSNVENYKAYQEKHKDEEKWWLKTLDWM